MARSERRDHRAHDDGLEPDPGWQKIDRARHLHAWVPRAKKSGFKTPTLVKVIDEEESETYFDEDGDEHYSPEVSHLECRYCGETIEPRYRRVGTKVIATGPPTIIATVTTTHPHEPETLVVRKVILTEGQFTEAQWAVAEKIGSLADAHPEIVQETRIEFSR